MQAKISKKKNIDFKNETIFSSKIGEYDKNVTMHLKNNNEKITAGN